MDKEKTLRLVELSKTLRPVVSRVDELRDLIRSSEAELNHLKRKYDSETRELIDLMSLNDIKFTMHDIEIAKHFKTKYLRIKKDDDIFK